MSKAFGPIRALNEITLDLYAEECLFLLGANEAGKTTQLRILAGLTRPTAGTFSIQGCSGRKLSLAARRVYPVHPHARGDDLVRSILIARYL